MTVLLADEIKRLCESDTPMIEPFSPSQLRPASYQLTLGEQIHVGGESRPLVESESVTLAPHQVAVVSTRETLRIPEGLIARWSLRVTNIYEGLLWTGGPQVDPGWEGPLFCPIYNLAERNVVLKCGEPLFTIDFVCTTDKDSDGYNGLKKDPKFPEIPFISKRKSLADHDRYRLRSAPYELIERVDRTEEIAKAATRNVDQLKDRMATFALIAIGVIGIIVSALTLMVAAQSFKFTLSIPIAIATILSIVAILISGFALYRSMFVKPTGSDDQGS